MGDGWFKFWIGVFAAVLAALLYFMWCTLEVEQRNWEAFSGQHECVVVGKKRMQVYNTVTVDAKGVPQVGLGTIPEHIAYQCNDDVTYWR